MKRFFTGVVVGVLAIILGSAVHAAGGGVAPPAHPWAHSGIFGTFDRGALRRGAKVYNEVCSACHGLRLVAYRNLLDIGFAEREIKAIAAEREVPAEPNDDGEIEMRPAIPSDRFVSPFPNDNAARAANGGALPPDLSLIVKARPGGADYIHALLTGYKEEAPAGIEVPEGMNYNEYYAGNMIAMASPLAEDGVEYADGTKASVEQMSEDVTVFLAWAAEPELEERKRMGIKVILFLLILTGLLYVVKRRVWADAH
ncbi:MAG: Cytochrome c1 [Alphaproteobacteria bacterium MarineAlpha11_Bin1]|nr:MAG: Cytochrome c1 [Alphaproteobacteria bacterium MarineAlpha11_Bin1]|tara:strand:+ start:3267 stop:4034 length:768 start_codon:yes stop_codon:yes gene_type:complete